MKIIAAIILLSFTMNGQTNSCNNHVLKFSIAIQPLDSFDSNTLNHLKKEIGDFWGRNVTVLAPVELPDSYHSKVLDQYSADSILNFLSGIDKKKGRITIGITHKNLYTIKESKAPNPMAYYDEGIFGLGYQPGNYCVISDFKIASDNDGGYIQSMRNIILHEMGHNRGLQHCSNPGCLMSEQNGYIIVLKKSREFCEECKSKLNRYCR